MDRIVVERGEHRDSLQVIRDRPGGRPIGRRWMWQGAYRPGAPRSKRAGTPGDLPGCHAGRRADYDRGTGSGTGSTKGRAHDDVRPPVHRRGLGRAVLHRRHRRGVAHHPRAGGTDPRGPGRRRRPGGGRRPRGLRPRPLAPDDAGRARRGAHQGRRGDPQRHAGHLGADHQRDGLPGVVGPAGPGARPHHDPRLLRRARLDLRFRHRQGRPAGAGAGHQGAGRRGGGHHRLERPALPGDGQAGPRPPGRLQRGVQARPGDPAGRQPPGRDPRGGRPAQGRALRGAGRP